MPAYLVNCWEPELKRDIQSAVADITNKNKGKILGYMRQHTVLSHAKYSLITEVLSTRQDQDEPIRKFYAKVQAMARNCKLAVPYPNNCSANHGRPYVSCTDLIVKHVVLNSIYDIEIRKDVLSVSGLDDKSLIYYIAG